MESIKNEASNAAGIPVNDKAEGEQAIKNQTYVKPHLQCIQGGSRYDLPFNFCRPSRPQLPESGINMIVEQFTSLLQGVFSALENTIQGLIGLAGQQAAPAPSEPGDMPAPIEDTSSPVTTEPEPETPAGKATKNDAKKLEKTGEFLWKPVSDKDKKLAVILPGKLTGKVKNVKILDANGKVLDKGNYSGTGNPLKNGEREHYRFEKAGNSYPDGAIVRITMKNGNQKEITIKDTSARLER